MSSSGGAVTTTPPPSSAAPPTTQQPTTTPPPATTPTTTPPPTTQAPPPTSNTPTTTPPPVTTSVTTAPSAPPSTQIFTSTVTQPPPSQQTSITPSTFVTTVSTSTGQQSTTAGQTTGVPSSTASSGASTDAGGLTAGAKIAIAVVIPIVVVALLIIAGIFWWRRRSKRMADEEERKKEMNEYAYNPNDDPTLPVGAVKDDSYANDDGGYRGWGPAGAVGSVGRKTSTNASSGAQNFSEGSTMYQPTSPVQGTYELADGQPGHHRNGTLDSDTMGHTAGAAGAAAAAGTAGGLRRGPSNASSTYSAGGHSQNSNEYPIPYPTQDYYTDNAYYQPGPYEAYNPNNQPPGGQPIMRESPARRLTQINENSPNPQQGGIARNF